MMERSRDRPVASRDDTLAVVRVACVEVLCIFDETRGGGDAESGVVARPPVPLDVVSGRVGMVERSGRGRGALHQCSAVVDFRESRIVKLQGRSVEGGVGSRGWCRGRWGRVVGRSVASVCWGGGEGRPPSQNGVESILSFRVVGGGALKMSKIGWRCRRSESSQGRSSGIDG